MKLPVGWPALSPFVCSQRRTWLLPFLIADFVTVLARLNRPKGLVAVAALEMSLGLRLARRGIVGLTLGWIPTAHFSRSHAILRARGFGAQGWPDFRACLALYSI